MRKVGILALGSIFALVFLFGIYRYAAAVSASVYVSPASASKKVGDTFKISVRVNPSGGSVDVVEGTLGLSKLSCKSVSLGSGIFAVTTPSCSNLHFSLGIQGGTTSAKTLFTVTVKAKSAGTGTALLSGVHALSAGKYISHSVSSGSYSIVTPCTCSAWSSWKNASCGGGGCTSKQMRQTRTRTCTPSGCALTSESRCVNDSCTSWTNDGCGKGSCPSDEMRQKRTCTYNCLSRSRCVEKSSCVSGEEPNGEEEEKPGETKFKIPVDNAGKTVDDFSGETPEEEVSVEIPKGNMCLSKENEPVTEITITKTEIPEDMTPKGAKIIKDTSFDFGPDDTKFSQPIEIAIAYDPANIPEGGQEEDIVVKKFDGEGWVSCPTTVDKENHLVTAEAASFTLFALFVEEKEVPATPTVPVTPTTPTSGVPYGTLIAALTMLAIIISAIYYLHRKVAIKIVIERKS